MAMRNMSRTTSGQLAQATQTANAANTAAQSAGQAAQSASQAAQSASSGVTTLTQRVVRNEDLMLCFYVMGNDIDVGFFNIIATLVGSSSRITTRLDDHGACQRAGITRSSAVRTGSLTPLDVLGQSIQLGVVPSHH
jgi:hypothetical protein